MTTSTTLSTWSIKALLRALLPPAFWLGVWQLAAFLVDSHVQGKGNELLLPYPATVFSVLLSLAATSQFWLTALASLGRILLGLLWGILLGSCLAALTSLSHWCRRLFAPAIRVIRATPVVSFILLVLLWTGRNTVAVIIAALMVLPVVWENLSRGIHETDRQLLEFAKAYRFSRWKTLRLIYIPSLRPYFLASVTTGMGLAWKSGVAAEVLCLPRPSIGTQIYNAKLYLEIPQLFAWTVTVIVLSLLLEWMLSRLLMRWNRRWQA